jgi:hypothetical protein
MKLCVIGNKASTLPDFSKKELFIQIVTSRNKLVNGIDLMLKMPLIKWIKVNIIILYKKKHAL